MTKISNFSGRSTNMTTISSQVNTIIKDCLYNDPNMTVDTLPEDAIRVEGIVRNFAFDPAKIESNKQKIQDLIDEMPSEFHKSGGGGGMSFLNLCLDKNGNQWGEHLTMEALVVLSIAAGLGEYSFPKDMWAILPGGVPYITLQDSQAA